MSAVQMRQPAGSMVRSTYCASGERRRLTLQAPVMASFGSLREKEKRKLRRVNIRSVLIAPSREIQIPVEEREPAATTVETKLRFVLVCDAFNSMAQRALLKLRDAGHEVIVHVFKDGEDMIDVVERVRPDVILCPYLTKRIPREIYEGAVPCLVIHPGIEGDRGMSSIDWALKDGSREWGVTILQAEEDMDAGPIWATRNFPIRRTHGEPPTKSSLYRIECVDAAMRCIDDVLYNISHSVPPRALDYSSPNVRGSLRPKLLQADRRLDWNLPAEELATIIRAGDSQPGTLSVVANEKYLLFGAHVEPNPPSELARSEPKTILGQRDGAILIQCGAGTALWITHLKKNVKSIKLPAVAALPASVTSTVPEVAAPPLELPMTAWPQTFQEIFYWTKNDVTYLWFDFYNGAMSTEQCHRLTQALDHLDRECSSKVLVLMGGINYFSNGIHLNTIEAAADPASESWENINAIDDVVHRILTCSQRVTVAAMMGNAGAGGVMAAIAADEVWAHRNVVLHPSYKPMELFGSEYWTHSLPKRVGMATATRLVTSVEPVSASEAKQVGLIDEVLSPSSVGFVESVIERAEKLSRSKHCDSSIAEKQRRLPQLEARIEHSRRHELEQMQKCFASEVYHQKRRQFVYKSAGSLPCQTELTPSRSVA